MPLFLYTVYSDQILTQTLNIPSVETLHRYSDINAGHNKLLFVVIFEQTAGCDVLLLKQHKRAVR